MIFRSVLFALAVCLAQVGGQEECPKIDFCVCLANTEATKRLYDGVYNRYFERRLPIRDAFAANISRQVREMNEGTCDDPVYRQTPLAYVYYVLELCGGKPLLNNFDPIWRNPTQPWTNAQFCVFIVTRFPRMCTWVNINDNAIDNCDRQALFNEFVYKQWRLCQFGCRL